MIISIPDLSERELKNFLKGRVGSQYRYVRFKKICFLYPEKNVLKKVKEQNEEHIYNDLYVFLVHTILNIEEKIPEDVKTILVWGDLKSKVFFLIWQHSENKIDLYLIDKADFEVAFETYFRSEFKPEEVCPLFLCVIGGREFCNLIAEGANFFLEESVEKSCEYKVEKFILEECEKIPDPEEIFSQKVTTIKIDFQKVKDLIARVKEIKNKFSKQHLLISLVVMLLLSIAVLWKTGKMKRIIQNGRVLYVEKFWGKYIKREKSKPETVTIPPEVLQVLREQKRQARKKREVQEMITSIESLVDDIGNGVGNVFLCSFEDKNCTVITGKKVDKWSRYQSFTGGGKYLYSVPIRALKGTKKDKQLGYFEFCSKAFLKKKDASEIVYLFKKGSQKCRNDNETFDLILRQGLMEERVNKFVIMDDKIVLILKGKKNTVRNTSISTISTKNFRKAKIRRK